jgi:hypothetical protein
MWHLLSFNRYELAVTYNVGLFTQVPSRRILRTSPNNAEFRNIEAGEELGAGVTTTKPTMTCSG